MTPRVTEAHLTARREQILDAALRSFAAGGFHNTTMQNIATEAGLSPGALYRYFPGKDDLIEAIGERGRQRSLATFASVGHSDNTTDLIRKLAGAFFGEFKDPDFALCSCVDVELWAESTHNEGVQTLLQQGFASVLGALRQIVERAQAVGDIDPELEPDAVAQVLHSTFVGYQVLQATGQRVELQPYVAAVVAMATGTYWRGGAADQRGGDHGH